MGGSAVDRDDMTSGMSEDLLAGADERDTGDIGGDEDLDS
jgi:hypothetical protein